MILFYFFFLFLCCVNASSSSYNFAKKILTHKATYVTLSGMGLCYYAYRCKKENNNLAEKIKKLERENLQKQIKASEQVGDKPLLSSQGSVKEEKKEKSIEDKKYSLLIDEHYEEQYRIYSHLKDFLSYGDKKILWGDVQQSEEKKLLGAVCMKAALVKNNYHLTGKIPEKCLDYHAYKNSFVEYRKKLYYESSEDNPQNVDEGMEGFSEHISRLCYDHYLLYNNSEHGITKEQQALVLWSKVYTSFVGDFEKVIFIKGPLDQELEWTIETMKKITLLFLNIHFLQSLCTNKGADFYKENNSIYLVNTPDTKDFYIINETETFIIENHQRKIFKTTRQENYSQRLKNLFCHICCESQKKHLTGCKKKGNDILYHPRKRNLFFYSKEFFPENDHEEKKVLVEYFTSLLKTVVLDSYF